LLSAFSKSNPDPATSAATTPSVKVLAGTGMDKKIARPKHTDKIWLVAAVVIVLAYIGYQSVVAVTGRTLNVNTNRIVISEVSRGVFEDFIPLRGRVTPAKTLYLDAVEGGPVERILV